MIYRVRLRLLSLLLMVTVLFFGTAPVVANPVDPADVGPYLDEFILAQMEANNIPNAAVAVVANGEVVYLQGYGFADMDQQIPVDANQTLFRIGSTAKLFTWTAIMQLVEQGQLDLNTDINQYLDFEIPARLINDSATPGPITLSHLMTHTAGFEAYPDEIFRLSPGHLLPLSEYVRIHQPQRAYPPGEVAAYSNYGAALAGYIVQHVSGQPFADYIEQHIYAPLDMNRSTFRQPLPAELAPDLARPYRFIDGAYREAEFEYMQEPEGSMSSTAGDMANFMLAHLQSGQLNGARILREETAQQMHSTQFTYHPDLGGMTFGFMEGTFNEQRTIFHGGSTMLYDSGFYLLPDQNVGLFVVYSGDNHLSHTALYQSFLDRYYPASGVLVPGPTEGMVQRSGQLVGEYQQNTRSFTTSESITSLFLGVIQVDVDPEGYLLVTHVGETNRFVEIEPGVYHNLREGRTQDYFGPFRTIAFGTDPFNRTLLMSDGPMTYSRAPIYASSMFTIPALLLILLLMLISLIVWLVASLVRLFRRRTAPASGLATAARLTGLVFAFLTVLFLLGVAATGMDDPLYQLPQPAFGAGPAWSTAHEMLPLVMAVVGVPVVIFAVLAWIKRFWKLPGRIHYTLFAGAAVLLLWILNYWNAL
jgi:CubicO group peptidase (beta-lactamase class C family)